RGPASYFYLPPMKLRALALRVALTVKLSQDDLRLVESLELPTAEPRYLLELARHRRWGSSVLLVDVCSQALPGLNVYSMLKHQTLVLTLDTVEFLEEKLLWHDVRYAPLYPFSMPYRDFP
ncbi:39S ribosomal protein L4, mitochondrial, partial [Nothoprocta perdicaria]|uniref:39S ribosomal protein L4, mitochondrial n=1 Tax=Nothoprocta perdicaria TaxID=30464 RepID=UPI000E1C36D4